ncbi:MAG: hypothetical protein M1819_005843 [Sarea resinae]|nr:MAG: hypothetical protein M1819_005843 [Sarea resinae]
MPSSAGTKNTSDPSAQDPIQESTGTITSDSLAAASGASGGAFSQNRNSGHPSSVTASNTTTNTTDTSGATTLAPAPDAETRDAQSEWQEAKALSSGPPKPSEEFASNAAAPSTSTSTSNVDAAPSYVGADLLSQPGQAKPKGKNITEGGFDADAPNASFNQDIGGAKDPGRAAESGFQRSNAESAADAAPAGGRQKGVEGGTAFDALDAEQAS